MARIRTIKPEFWVDEKVVELSPWARLLFIGLWNFADDQGYIDHAPKRIKMQVFPGDTTDVVPLIDELLTQGVVRAWRSPIGPVLQVINWSRHQRVDHPAKSRFDASQLVAVTLPESSRGSREALARPLGVDPLPPSDLDARTGDENDHQMPSRGLASDSDGSFPSSPTPTAPHLESVTDSPREDSRTLAPEGKGREGKGRDLSTGVTSKAAAPNATEAPDGAALTENQRSKRITDAYKAAQPMCKWVAINGIVLTAIKAGSWTDDEIQAAVLRLAADRRSVTVEALRIELDGKPASRTGNGGWDGPHLNHDDPHAFDGYRPHHRENTDDVA